MRMICVLLPVLALSVPAFPQSGVQEPPTSLGWLTLGVGIGGNRDLHGFGVCITASYLSDFGLLSIDYLGASRVGREPAIPSTARLEAFSELSGLYGICYHAPFFLVSASAGMGVVWVTKRVVSFGEKTAATVGIPLKVEAFITPLPVLGMGLTGFANVNGKASYGGLPLCLRVGKLR